MALTSIDFTVAFNLTTTPKNFNFTDTTDWVGQGVALADATVVITSIVAPDGNTIYSNTNHASPDIDVDVSLTKNDIPLPLLAGGGVMYGSYTFTLEGQDANTSDTATKTVTKTVDYTAPTINVTMTFDCQIPRIQSVDNTNYNLTFNGIVTVPTLVRDHDIKYPPTTGQADATTTGKTLTTTTVYTQKNTPLQYSAVVTSDLTYDLNDGVSIIDQITGSDIENFLCDPNLCDVYCGLEAQYDRMVRARGTGREDIEKALFNELMAIAALVDIAISCGEGTKASELLEDMRDIGSFSSDCACADESTPQLIIGTGTSIAGTSTVVAGSGITVTSIVAGTNTEYTVSFDATLLSKLNALKTVVVAAGTGGITVGSATVGDTTTYTVNNTSAPQDRYSVRVDMTTNGGTPPTITETSEVIQGSALQSGTIVSDNLGANWSPNNTCFTVNGFFASGTVDYHPTIEIIELDPLGSSSATCSDARQLQPEIMTVSATEFQFTFKNLFGSSTTGSFIDANYETITLIINLDA